MNDIQTLMRFLQSPEDFPWNEALYLPKNKDEWSLNSPLAVWDPDDCEEGDDDPEIVKANNLTYALGVSIGQDIVANAKEQMPNATMDELLNAFLYYCKNDAFISFKK